METNTYNSLLNILSKSCLLAAMHLFEQINCTRFCIFIFFLLLKLCEMNVVSLDILTRGKRLDLKGN